MISKWLPLMLSFSIVFTEATKTTDNRIIRGHPVKAGEFPYQVSIRRSYNDFHFCGGSIINSNHILTAAHCMYYAWGGVLPPYVVSIFYGMVTLKILPSSVYRNASKITVHPEYDENEMSNDIAIIEISESLPVWNKVISPIPLNGDPAFTHENLICIVSGWGIQKFNTVNVSEYLLATEVKLMNDTICQEKYKKINVTLYPGMLCANDENGADACQGDSGGPLTCNGRLVAVISTGSGCGDSDYPGIYSKIDYFLPWILNTLHAKTRNETKLLSSSEWFDNINETTTTRSDTLTRIPYLTGTLHRILSSVLLQFKRTIANCSRTYDFYTSVLVLSLLTNFVN